MSFQDKNSTIENHLHDKLENILRQDRREMQERTEVILYGIHSHAAEVKKEVHHHITQLAKVQFALINSTHH